MRKNTVAVFRPPLSASHAGPGNVTCLQASVSLNVKRVTTEPACMKSCAHHQAQLPTNVSQIVFYQRHLSA